MQTDRPVSILIVDDEVDIREILQFNLEYEGYQVDLASSAEEALAVLRPEHKLILLDVMMGGMSGFKMADVLRKQGNNVPIIFLTAKDTENDMLTGFSIGGDDYISKPFSIKEVIARVRTVLRRTLHASPAPAQPEADVYRHEGLAVDFTHKTLTVDGATVDLTRTEYDILTLFVRNEGAIFSREDVLARVWGEQGLVVVDRTVDVHIARLRKKLGVYARCIVNRTGYGYSFKASPTSSRGDDVK